MGAQLCQRVYDIGERRKDQIIYLGNVSKEKIPVGDGNKYSDAYTPIEEALGKPRVEYLRDPLLD